MRMRAPGSVPAAASVRELCEATNSAIECLEYLDGCPPYEVLACVLLAGSADGYIRMWNPHSGVLLGQMNAITTPLRPPPAFGTGVATRKTPLATAPGCAP